MCLVMGQPIDPLQKIIIIIIKTFVLLDAPQPIKLPNMNHNKYLGSWKKLRPKMMMNKVKNIVIPLPFRNILGE